MVLQFRLQTFHWQPCPLTHTNFSHPPLPFQSALGSWVEGVGNIRNGSRWDNYLGGCEDWRETRTLKGMERFNK